MVYAKGFNCSPELPDGTTNSVEVEIELLRNSKREYLGRGYANTVSNSGPFRIVITYLGAPKGYGSSVNEVRIKSIACRM